jgi:hypothetical protein
MDAKAVVHDLPQPRAIDQLAPAHAAPSPLAIAKTAQVPQFASDFWGPDADGAQSDQ